MWFWAKFLTHFGTICMLFGQIFIAVNGQILKLKSDHLVTLIESERESSVYNYSFCLY